MTRSLEHGKLSLELPVQLQAFVVLRENLQCFVHLQSEAKAKFLRQVLQLEPKRCLLRNWNQKDASTHALTVLIER
jgi:hypothetical protein